MTFDELCAKTREIIDIRNDESTEGEYVEKHTLEALDEDGDFYRVVRAVIEAMDFHVNDKGEVCDPRPDPLSSPRQQNVHWAGPGKKRRR